MKDIAIVNGDMSLDTFVEGVLEFTQSVSIELGTRLGEWFLDEDYGTDFAVLQDKVDDDEIIAEISRVVANEERLETDGDIELTFDKASRELSVYIPLIDAQTNEETGLEVGISGID